MSNIGSTVAESETVAEEAETLPLELARSASFPNPGRDYYQGGVDLNRHLNKRPASTFVLRVEGDALVSLGLSDGDEILVDRAIDPRIGRVLVVVVDGERRVGVMQVRGGQAALVSDIEVLPLTADVVPWGVATIGIKHLPGL